MIPCAGRDMRKWKYLYISEGLLMHVALLENKLRVFTQICDPEIPLLGIILEKLWVQKKDMEATCVFIVGGSNK